MLDRFGKRNNICSENNICGPVIDAFDGAEQEMEAGQEPIYVSFSRRRRVDQGATRITASSIYESQLNMEVKKTKQKTVQEMSGHP